MTAQAIAERQDQVATVQQHPATDGGSLLAIISRAASDPTVDIDKMERLLQMHERLVARDAKTAYAAAFAQMQAELPVIEERGKIVVKAKGQSGERDGNVIQSTPYALWEDINDAIKPVLSKHGFALSFRTGQTPDGRVTVTAVLSHREGHQEETTMFLQHDSTGSKNAVQAIGSSTSYGKRYAAAALLNLTSRDGAEEDDDGRASVGTLSNAEGRDPYKDMQAELDACPTLSDLETLWLSKAFKIEFQKAPIGWQRTLLDRKDELKRDFQAKAARATVAPNFDNLK